MTIHRYAAKRDLSEPLIVKHLEAAGYEVHRLAKPVDLAVRKGWYPRGACLLIECKTPLPNGKLPERKDRAAQNAFCNSGGAVKVGSPGEAIQALRDFENVLTAP